MPTILAECEKVAARCARRMWTTWGSSFNSVNWSCWTGNGGPRSGDSRRPSSQDPRRWIRSTSRRRPSVNKPLVLESDALRVHRQAGECSAGREHSGTGKTHLATALAMEACGRANGCGSSA